MPESAPRLLVVRGRDCGRELVIAGRQATVGRGTDNDLVLSDLSVSRHHVTVVVDETGVRARDEGSGNGTMANGKDIDGEVTLRDGDELEIGHTVIRLVYPVVTHLAPGIGPADTADLLLEVQALVQGTPRPAPQVIPTARNRVAPVYGGVGAVVLCAVVAWVLWPRAEPPPAAPEPVAAPASAPAPMIISSPPEPISEPEPDPDPEPEPPAPRPRRSHVSSVERSAAAKYAARQFADAASTLRSAADRDEAARERLLTLARDYAAVGAGMARGDANLETSPTVALVAFQLALAADIRSGNGEHTSFLRGRLARVAPAAAIGYLASGHYEQARAACDIAVTEGAGGNPRIAQARTRLETVAAALYTQAENRGDDYAQALYRRILRIVPATSQWSRKALAALEH